MPFFENLQDKAIRFPNANAAILDTERTARGGKTLTRLSKVAPEQMELWMKQWEFSSSLILADSQRDNQRATFTRHSKVEMKNAYPSRSAIKISRGEGL